MQESTKEFTGVMAEGIKVYTKWINNAKGRGVFAKSNIKANELIEECPVIIFSEQACVNVTGTPFDDLYFTWLKDKEEERYCTPLGFGVLYNHSNNPNAEFDKNYEKKIMYFTAVKDIPKDAEICIKYGTLWFKVE